MNEYMKILGLKVVDKITGFQGVASSVGFDLYGCVQVVVTPVMAANDGKLEDSRWFDHKRLTVLDKTPVMTVPTFEVKKEQGGYNKPLPNGF